MRPQICVFLLWLAQLARAETFLFKLEGEVPSQEFVYYKIMHPGNLLLVLETLDGDADIYVSEKTPAPTYQPENYDFHSATCGVDTVTISKNLKRPMAIGIYGYSSDSRFTLGVYEMNDSDNVDYFEEDTNIKETSESGSEKKDNSRAMLKVKKKRNLPNGLWSFLELFELFFL